MTIHPMCFVTHPIGCEIQPHLDIFNVVSFLISLDLNEHACWNQTSVGVTTSQLALHVCKDCR